MLIDPPTTARPQAMGKGREGASLSTTVTTSFSLLSFSISIGINFLSISKSIQLMTLLMPIDLLAISRREPLTHADQSADY